MSTKRTKLRQTTEISWLYFLPLLLIAGFVPLLVYGKYVNLSGTAQALFWTGQTELLDFFSYWKSKWVIFLTITSTVIYIFLLLIDKLPFKKEYKYYIPMVVYAFLVILSTIFAVDKLTALNGFVDMYQGMWVLLSYMMITFLVINYVNTERDILLFVKAFIFLIVIEGFIGVGQYFGFDIFNSKFGNGLIIPSGVFNVGLSFNFGKHTIYGTLFNTNFVGSFAALMLPIVVAFLASVKTLKQRLIAGIALFLCLFTWIGCNSRAGYIGVSFALMVALIMLRKYVIKYWKFSVIVLFLIILTLIGFNFISEGKLVKRIESLNIFKAISDIKEKNQNEDTFKFYSIELNDNTVSIKTSHQDLNIKVDDEKLYFIDNKGEFLPVITDEDGYSKINAPDKEYLKVKMTDAYPGFTIIAPLSSNGSLNFYISDDNSIKIISSGVRIVDPIVAKSFKLFNGLETFASNRGYIWSRTIPLLNKYIFYGAGADNYPIVFPQDDFVAKLNIGMPATAIIDKPHNMYLQIAINTGIISLLALVIVWGIYIISCIKLYWNLKYDSIYKYIGIACFISILGYLFAGIFNDHIVSVSPIFWCILGLGISINAKIKTEEE